MQRYQHHILASASICVGILAAAPAYPASLQEVDQNVWWDGVTDLPSYVNMFLYVPDQLATHPPIVVGVHHCQGTGTSSYSEMSSLVSLADQNGFIMIFPEATGQNCWDAGSDRSLTHDGKGDTHAIVQMVRYTLATYDGNRDRVYSVGTSSGGIMTEALLGVYPDVFMAGVSVMGVPCGCWAEGYNDVVGKPADGTGQWSGPCSGGNVTKTGQEWGDLVRSYFPGYAGHRPRLQHWHGTADTTLNYKNVAEDIKEWTNLLELSETPTGTDSPKTGTTHQFWTNSCDYTVYETFELDGVGHAVPLDANATAAYFGLDDTEGQDPETAACPGAVPGGGTGGVGGTGGAPATGGAGGAGGADGGIGGVDTGGSPPTGGVPGTGGEPASGGAGLGGGLPTGGAVPTGGTPAATGGVSVTGGTSASGGAVGTGGVLATGGISAQVGGGGTGVGGAPATGGFTEIGGYPDSTVDNAESSGCQCALAGHAGDFDARAAALLVAALGLALGRRRRAR